MNIKLTKDEWEFLKKYINCENEIPLIDHDFTKTWCILECIDEKLGSKWIDEEEELRKFNMGFAYKLREKDE